MIFLTPFWHFLIGAGSDVSRSNPQHCQVFVDAAGRPHECLAVLDRPLKECDVIGADRIEGGLCLRLKRCIAETWAQPPSSSAHCTAGTHSDRRRRAQRLGQNDPTQQCLPAPRGPGKQPAPLSLGAGKNPLSSRCMFGRR
jgi:hypothetical protein